MKPQAPTGLQPPVVTETGAFIRWDMNTETDIASYRVYRSDNPNAGFTRVDMELITGISFPDPNYRPGFYYRVTAVDESGNESDPSAIVRAPE
jgi:fibronectin type 3 domain-containing protein